ncbi:MAG: hypothetical protein DLM54_06275 [Acidimicrobiales bacterium]|nr:MAG: hypothetical protein DLM54_06275 [Acidimicrobiales bacterium]
MARALSPAGWPCPAPYAGQVPGHTHQRCAVGFPRSADTFQCPCHGAVFSAQTGQALQRPATRPLGSVAVQEGVDGSLYVNN